MSLYIYRSSQVSIHLYRSPSLFPPSPIRHHHSLPPPIPLSLSLSSPSAVSLSLSSSSISRSLAVLRGRTFTAKCLHMCDGAAAPPVTLSPPRPHPLCLGQSV